jgi:hypothetical protein
MTAATKPSTIADVVTLPASRARGGDNILWGAKHRSRIAKTHGDALGDLPDGDPDTAYRIPLPAGLSEVAVGGELVPVDSPAQDTVTNPDYVTADASRQRLEMAERANVLELALDAADTIKARNSLEKAMAHQMAALHAGIMRLTARLNDINEGHSYREWNGQQRNIESCRLANTIARQMGVPARHADPAAHPFRWPADRHRQACRAAGGSERGRSGHRRRLCEGRGSETEEDRGSSAEMTDVAHTATLLARLELAEAAPRCGARTRSGRPCKSPALHGKQRCRMHGGASTGPRTPEGKERARMANWKHGLRSGAFIAERQRATATRRMLLRLIAEC